jgi:NAD(P)H-flavin reductase/ferredoxin
VSFTIRLSGTEVVFECGEQQNVLEAALAAGWELPYSCRRGVCESCRAPVLSGEFDGPTVLGGDALLCQARPRSDLEIAPREVRRVDPGARKRINAKIYRIERPAPDVAVMQLRFPAGVRVRFRAGQYLEVILADGSRRAFSMANPPHQNDGALLHVRVLPEGAFSERVLSTLTRGSVVTVEMPFGDFHLREGDKPAILLAGGTGFAPMKAIVEDLIRRNAARQLALYWGAHKAQDLYAADLPRKWAAQRPGFRFVPVLSEETWAGRTGLVHEAVLADFSSLEACEVYACGAPAMVAAARRDFTRRRGLPPAAFYCDPFAPA